MPPVKKTLAEKQQRQLVMSRNHRQPWNASSIPPVLRSSPNQFRSLYMLIPSMLCVGLGHLISDNKEAQERLGLCNDYTLHLRVTVKRKTSVHLTTDQSEILLCLSDVDELTTMMVRGLLRLRPKTV
jgi:hypothetical protein